MAVKDKSKYNEYMRKYMAERYERRKQAIYEQLGGKCKVCGSTDNFEIDHIDRREKSFTVGTLLAGISKEKLETELKKCQLLCKKCHKEKTHSELGAKHGSPGMYRHQKCRCRICNDANNKRSRDYKRKQKLKLKGQVA